MMTNNIPYLLGRAVAVSNMPSKYVSQIVNDPLLFAEVVRKENLKENKAFCEILKELNCLPFRLDEVEVSYFWLGYRSEKTDCLLREFVGSQIKAKRVGLNLKSKELASKVGIPESSLCLIENGKMSTTLDNIEKICNGLGCTLMLM